MQEPEISISKIEMAIFMPNGFGGQPIHRNRPSHGIVLNVGCVATYSFNGAQTLRCESGDCIYLPKGSSYIARKYDSFDTPGGGVYAINFQIPDDLPEHAPTVISSCGDNVMASYFSKAAKSWTKKEVGYLEECYASLYMIIRKLKRESDSYSHIEPTAPVIIPALEYINENYTTENISVSHLADLCGISEVYLRRLFVRSFGTSPVNYIRDMRIRYAKDLLTNTGYSITDAAMLAGFNDASYFSREFKRAVGVSPKEYTKI